MKKINVFILTFLTVLLFSCASHEERSKRVGSTVSQTGSKIGVGIDRLKRGDIVTEANAESYIVDGYWVDPNPIVTKEKELDPILQRRISIVTATKISIEKLSQDIGSASGLYFTMSPEVVHGLRLTESLQANSNVDSEEESESQSKAKELTFMTELRASWVDVSVLDVVSQLASELNISWEYISDKKTIHLYKYRSETYDVHLPGENINYKTSMTNESLVAGGGNASVSGSAISTDVTLNTDAWVGLTNRLKIITSEGGRFSTDRANFKVTLDDTDGVHEEFKAMLAEVQKEGLQQIVFDVSLLTFDGKQQDLYGLNIESLYENAIIGNIKSVRPVDAALSMLSLGVDNSTASHTKRASIFVDALSKYGTASIVQNYQRSTLNNQVASIMQARNRPYLRNVSIPVAGSNFNQNGEASLTDLVTGFSLSIRPHMINEEDMLVSLTINRRSAPNEFESVDAGAGISLERPDIKDDSEFQQFIIGNNQTKIISGSVVEQAQGDKSGAIDREYWWLGGSSGHSQERRMIMLFITARVI